MFSHAIKFHPLRVVWFSQRTFSKGNFSSRCIRSCYKQSCTNSHPLKRRLLSATATPSKNPIRRGPVSWISFGVCLLAGGGFVAYVRYVKEQKQLEREKEEKKSIGMAAIGGPFELSDTNGKTVTDADFHGKWVLLYFGFCHCPDICPDQLEKLSEVVNRLDAIPSLPKVQPLFITVDPNRDTIQHVKEYIKDFHPRMMGLAGTEEQVKKVCKEYRVYFSAGPKDEDEDYIVDHTIITYLLNPEGNFIEYFGQNRTIEEVVAAVSTKMALTKKKFGL